MCEYLSGFWDGFLQPFYVIQQSISHPKSMEFWKLFPKIGVLKNKNRNSYHLLYHLFSSMYILFNIFPNSTFCLCPLPKQHCLVEFWKSQVVFANFANRKSNISLDAGVHCRLFFFTLVAKSILFVAVIVGYLGMHQNVLASFYIFIFLNLNVYASVYL